MKNKRFLASFLICGMLLVGGQANAFDPPKKLKWGMPYDSVKFYLRSAYDIKVKGLNQKNTRKAYKEYQELQLQKGQWRADAKNLKVLKKKAHHTYLIFDEDTSLAALHYILSWENYEDYKGARQCWVFHSEIKAALVSKYGEPALDETSESIRATNIASGIKYVTRWEDNDGSSISLAITRQTHNMIIATLDHYLILVLYFAPSTDARDVLIIENDEL